MEAAYKGAPGLLELSLTGLVWKRRGHTSAPALTIGFGEIRVHCMSAPSSAKLLLKVVTGSRNPKAPGYVFHFQSKLNAARDRDTIVRGLLAGRTKQSPAEPVTNPKADAPVTSPKADAPVTAVIDTVAHKDPLSGLRLDKKPNNKRKRAESKTISAAEMAEALQSRPALAELYREQVPMVLSEAQFWSRYLSSEQLHTSGELHGTGQLQEAAEAAEAGAAEQIASQFNLSTELDSGGHTLEPPTKGSVIGQLNNGAKAFIQRLKQTAVPCVKAPSMSDLTQPAAHQWLPMRQSVESLEPQHAAAQNSKSAPLRAFEGHGVPKVEPRLRRCFEQKSEARQLLEELRSNSQRAEGACDPSSQLLAAHAKAVELLRHFWASEACSKRYNELQDCIKALLRTVLLQTVPSAEEHALWVQLPEDGSRKVGLVSPLEALRSQLLQAGSSAHRTNDVHLNQIARKHATSLQASLGIVFDTLNQ